MYKRYQFLKKPSLLLKLNFLIVFDSQFPPMYTGDGLIVIVSMGNT